MYLLPEKWFLDILKLTTEVIVFQDLSTFLKLVCFPVLYLHFWQENILGISMKSSSGRNLASVSDGLSLGSGMKPEWRSSSVIYDGYYFLKMPFDRPSLTSASLLSLTFVS